MTKQNPNAETIDFRFVLTDKPNSPRMLAAKWLRSHKTEALDFLWRAMKPEIVADNDATPSQICGAKIESAAFHRYMAEALSAQIAIDRGELPVIVDAPPISPATKFPTSPQLSSSTILPADDDEDGDDDETPIVDID